MSTDSVLKEIKLNMAKCVEYTLKEFSSLHTGKATPAMVENVVVEVYGSPSRVKDISAITTPDSRTIQIQPWDKESVKAIEKGILAANIGLNPRVDGMLIRCSVPELSRERRQDLAKVAHNMAEDGRVKIRGVRRDGLEVLKKLEKAGVISEDDLKKVEKDVQKMTDSHISEIDTHLQKKTEDLMKV